MKTIAFMIQKGGTGKTSLAGHVAWAASDSMKVCVIDADPQGSISNWFLKDAPPHELADVLHGESIEETLVQVKEQLHMIPTFSIAGDLASTSTKLLEEPYLLQDLIQKLDYDLVVIDASPGMGPIERSVIVASDEVITPLTPEFFSWDGLDTFKSFLDKTNRTLRGRTGHKAIVANMVNKSFRRHKDIIEKYKTLNYNLFVVPQDSKIAEAQIVNQTVFTYAPDSRSIPAILQLTQEVSYAS